MKKILYIAEGLATLGVSFVLIGGSYSGVSCWCLLFILALSGGKVNYQQQMLAKYRDKMFTASERVITTPPVQVKSKDRGYLSGTVLGEGNPLEGVHVIAWDTSYSRGWGTYTDAQGYYIITHLPEAPEALYKVQTDNDLGYVDKFWDNKPNFWSADTVRVVAGDTVKDINFDLQLAGYISGTLTGEDGDGLENFWIYVYDDELNYISGGWPDNFGFYTVGDLEEGVSYRVQASGWGSPYVDGWYNDKPDVVFADAVTVIAQDTTKNIDFELTLGGCISGTVTGPGKGPLEDIIIEAYSIVNGGFVRTDWLGTDSLGRYIISGLPLSSGRIGGYRIRSGRSLQYAHQWYSGKFNFRSADVVSLTQPGDTIKGIDFVLTTGGLITGVVTDEYNDSLPGIAIYVYDNTANYPLEPAAFVATYNWPDTLRGIYEIALPPGDYRVRTANLLGYIDEYYDDQTSWDAANLVSVSMAGTTQVDFSLSMGGRIEGTVYEATKKGGLAPLPRVAVAAIRANTGEVVTFINSALDGFYSVRGLPTGWYKLCAFPWGDMIYSSLTDLVDIIHAFEFYDDKKSFKTADSIYVVAPDSVTGIDFILGVGGAIAGKVYGQPEEPVKEAEVTTYGYGSPYYDWIPVWTPGITDEAGYYVIPGLGSGNYKVQAEAEDYPIQWWDSKPDSSSADLVLVTAPDTTKDIDFYLATASIAGNLSYYFNDTPVPNALVLLTGGMFDSAYSDTSGSYTFTDLMVGLDYTVRAIKVDDDRSAIALYDASYVSKYFVGTLDLNPYQRIAGDVTGNGEITPYDASYISRYFVGLIGSFPVGKDWAFIPCEFSIDTTNWFEAPDSIFYHNLSSNQIDQDYKGILYGDVTGNWPSAKTATLKTGKLLSKPWVDGFPDMSDVVTATANEVNTGTNKEIWLREPTLKDYGRLKPDNLKLGGSVITTSVNVTIPDTFAYPGDTINVPIMVDDATGKQIYSAGIFLTYNSDVLTAIEAITDGTIVSGWYPPITNVLTDEVRIAMYGNTPLEGSGNLVFVTFVVSESAGDSTTIHFSEMIFNEGIPEASTQDGLFTVTVVSISEDTHVIPRAFSMHQNYPNPVSSITWIRYALLKTTHVSLKIYSITGQPVRTLLKEVQEAGHYEVVWDGQDGKGKRVTSGVYFYRIEATTGGGFGTSDYKETKKLILLR